MSRLITATTIKKRPAGLFAVVVFAMLLAARDKGHVVSPTRPTDPSTPNSPSGPTPQLLDASWYIWEGWWLDLVEQLPDSSYLVVDGTAVTILSSTGISGTLHGDLWLFQRSHQREPIAFCYATDHGFVLSK